MAFDMKEMEKLLKSISKTDSSKSQKEMAKLQSKLAIRLAEQQAEWARQLAAQQAADSLAAQREANAFQQPFMIANATGVYNGQQTLQSKQYEESIRQFNKETELENERLALEKDIKNRQLALEELSQQQDNAIAQGNLDLSRQIETEKVRLQAEQQAANERLQTAELSGYLENGQLTETARAARAREGLEGTQLMGVDAQGRLTDSSQQWRMNAALEAARTNAQLGAQASDYFQAAAYNRDPAVQDALAFLNAQNQGSSMGFRSAATGVPGTASIQNLQGGQPINPAVPGDWAVQAAGSNPNLDANAIRAAGPDKWHAFLAQAQAQEVVNPGSTFLTYKAPSPQQNVPGVQGAPDGPSQSVSAAMAAQAGQPAAFTTPMNKAIPEGEQMVSAMPFNEQAFTAAQSAMPQQPMVQGSIQKYNQNVSMQPDVAQQRLIQIQNRVIKPGAHRLAPGTMESWSDTEKGLVTSALKASGLNPTDFEQSYNRARLQTNVGATTI